MMTGIPPSWPVSESRATGVGLAGIGLAICHVTNDCNLDCRYCSASAPACPGRAALMPLKTLRTAAELIFAKTRRPEVGWIFFGGEPLLAPLAWYQRAMELVRGIAEEYITEVHFGMQTNGVLLSDEVADFLAANRLRPSISLDGPPGIHDQMRAKAVQTLAGVRRMRERGLTPTILVVVGPHNVTCMDEVLDFLGAESVRRAKFNFYHAAGRASELGALPPGHLAQARLRLLDRMLESDAVYDVNTARLMHLLARASQVRPDDYRGCGAPHCGAGWRHVAISPEGRLFPCDRCVSENRCGLGDLRNPLPPPAWDRQLWHFHQAHEPGGRCADCPVRPVCYFCCTTYRASTEDVNALCDTHRLLWPELVARRERIRGWTAAHPLEELRPATGRAEGERTKRAPVAWGEPRCGTPDNRQGNRMDGGRGRPCGSQVGVAEPYV